MDAPNVEPRDLREALHQLVSINRTLGGHSTTLAGLKKLLPATSTGFSFLDVGCGSGDTLLAVANWARRHGLAARLRGIELSDISANMARERLSRAGVPADEHQLPEQIPDDERITARIEVANLFDLPPTDRYDMVHAALVLHHMADDAEVVRALARMAALARRGVIINDLHRHPVAFRSIQLLTRTLSSSPILQHDAPLSVQRSFTRTELLRMAKEAGLTDLALHWRWAFRWLLTGQPGGFRDTEV